MGPRGEAQALPALRGRTTEATGRNRVLAQKEAARAARSDGVGHRGDHDRRSPARAKSQHQGPRLSPRHSSKEAARNRAGKRRPRYRPARRYRRSPRGHGGRAARGNRAGRARQRRCHRTRREAAETRACRRRGVGRFSNRRPTVWCVLPELSAHEPGPATRCRGKSRWRGPFDGRVHRARAYHSSSIRGPLPSRRLWRQFVSHIPRRGPLGQQKPKKSLYRRPKSSNAGHSRSGRVALHSFQATSGKVGGGAHVVQRMQAIVTATCSLASGLSGRLPPRGRQVTSGINWLSPECWAWCRITPAREACAGTTS